MPESVSHAAPKDSKIVSTVDRYLRCKSSADKALVWVHDNPELWEQKIICFDDAVNEINRMITERDFPEELLHIREIWRLTGGNEIPTTQDLSKMDNIGCKIAQETLENAKCKWSTDWGFWLDEVEEPERAATGMFIELYGQYLDDEYPDVNMRQEIVYLLEETIIHITPQDAIFKNPIISDVLDWIWEDVETARNRNEALPMSDKILSKVGL